VAPALTGGVSVSGVWSARDTTPAEIEEALRTLMVERSDEERVHAPARVLNLVVVIDREWKGEIANRLDRVGRDNPARTIMITVERRRTTIDARVTLAHEPPAEPGGPSLFRERIELDVGVAHLPKLETVVHPILATEVGTVVWSPHGYHEAIEAMVDIANSVLIDSLDDMEPHEALDRAALLSHDLDVVDLAWLRSNPWRERIAATFDPEKWRDALSEINKVVVRMHPGSGVSALLLLGWFCSRLSWDPEPIMTVDATHQHGVAYSRTGPVELCVDIDATMPVPGLSGVTIETQSGISISLDRGPGGLIATRRVRDESEAQWAVLGASRGEDGILAHGVTHALLPDLTYGPALAAARTMSA
jgi:glucose-6-phosphate dehydrogenase assembly protein OpcA